MLFKNLIFVKSILIIIFSLSLISTLYAEETLFTRTKNLFKDLNTPREEEAIPYKEQFIACEFKGALTHIANRNIPSIHAYGLSAISKFLYLYLSGTNREERYSSVQFFGDMNILTLNKIFMQIRVNEKKKNGKMAVEGYLFVLGNKKVYNEDFLYFAFSTGYLPTEEGRFVPRTFKMNELFLNTVYRISVLETNDKIYFITEMIAGMDIFDGEFPECIKKFSGGKKLCLIGFSSRDGNYLNCTYFAQKIKGVNRDDLLFLSLKKVVAEYWGREADRERFTDIINGIYPKYKNKSIPRIPQINISICEEEIFTLMR